MFYTYFYVFKCFWKIIFVSISSYWYNWFFETIPEKQVKTIENLMQVIKITPLLIMFSENYFLSEKLSNMFLILGNGFLFLGL